jgi:hypothetical protein
VILPKHPIIRYARVDVLDEAGNARTGFEIALALCMSLVGAHVGSSTPVPLLHWLFEIASGLAAIAFLVRHASLQKRAREEAET